MNRKLVRIIAIILAVLMVFGVLASLLSYSASAAPTREQLNELKQKQADLKQQMQETKSKINSTFLSILSGMVYAAAIVTGAFHGFTISLKGWSIFVLMFAMLALHSFIGYYYERKLGSFDREDEE